MMEFNMMEQSELIIWLYTSKHIRQLKKYGHVIYTSYKMRYCVIYVDKQEKEFIKEKIERLNFVKKVEESYRDDIDMTFKDAIKNRIDRDRVKSEETANSALEME